MDANNLYGWAMSQKLPVNGFKWKKIKKIKIKEKKCKCNEDFTKRYNGNSNKEFIIEADVEYPKYLHDLLSDLRFLPERMKIKVCNKLVR